MAMFLRRPHKAGEQHCDARRRDNPLVPLQRAFERKFEDFRRVYGHLVDRALRGPRWFMPAFLAIAAASRAITPFLG